MTKKLAIPADPTPWWEDSHSRLAEARRENSELAGELETRIRAGYLRQIRLELESRPSLRKMVGEAEPASGAKPAVMENLAHLARFGSDDVFEESVDQVLRELESQRRADPSLYLVDDRTGELVMPFGEGDVFTPPDFVDEAGITRPGRPAVHPGIAAGLAMRRAESHRMQKVRDAAADPVTGKAYEHILHPERILEGAVARLKHVGVSCGPVEAPDIVETIEFGREHAEAASQSVNPAFHRSSMFASVLAQKVLGKAGKGGTVEFGKVRPVRTNRESWYAVDVRISSSG
jgi:hypothetical protein